MIANRYEGPAFNAGDELVLASGSYQGTPGVFLNLKEDPNWADLRERNGKVRSHPLAWLEHAAPRRGFSMLLNSLDLNGAGAAPKAGLPPAGVQWRIEAMVATSRPPQES